MNTYQFEGSQMTLAEVCKMVPRLSRAAVQRALAAGRNTRIAMMTFNPQAAAIAGSRKAYAARGKPSHMAGVINAERNR